MYHRPDRDRDRDSDRHARERERDRERGRRSRSRERSKEREGRSERDKRREHRHSSSSRGSKRRRGGHSSERGRRDYTPKDRERRTRRERKREVSRSESYRSRSRSSSGSDTDDDQGHLNIKPGEDLTSRYKVLEIIGEGTFGKVVCCWDRDKRRNVALKIIRAIEKYREAAMIEIEILDKMHEHDADGREICISLLGWFEFKGHVVMVFNKYGLSLYDFLKKNNYYPFDVKIVADIGYQLLKAVSFMHDLTLIHTDLKPENILFKHPDYRKIRLNSSPEDQIVRIPEESTIKLIDFGSATFDSHHHTRVVSTRHYRAPEVILGLGWTYPADLWSIGCILAELYSGNALFITHDNVEHLAMMERVFGPIPHTMTRKASKKARNFFKDGVLRWPELVHERVKHGTKYVDRMESLQDTIREEDTDFYDLLRQLLNYQPEGRITAREALRHPFFDGMRSKYERYDYDDTEKELGRSRTSSAQYDSSDRGKEGRSDRREHRHHTHRHHSRASGREEKQSNSSSASGSSRRNEEESASPVRKRSKLDHRDSRGNM